jgi:hypothetical protein
VGEAFGHRRRQRLDRAFQIAYDARHPRGGQKKKSRKVGAIRVSTEFFCIKMGECVRAVRPA